MDITVYGHLITTDPAKDTVVINAVGKDEQFPAIKAIYREAEMGIGQAIIKGGEGKRLSHLTAEALQSEFERNFEPIFG